MSMDILNLMSKSLDDGGLGVDKGIVSAISGCFDDMRIAEEEIDKAIKKHPEFAVAVWNVFEHCQRPEIMHGFDERVYKHHVRELIQRVRDGESLVPATDAECLCILSRTSLTAGVPLTHDASVAVLKLMNKIMPGWDRPWPPDQTTRAYSITPTHVHADEEVLAKIRRRHSLYDRKLVIYCDAIPPNRLEELGITQLPEQILLHYQKGTRK